ncbi:discoidin domain-containing protein [Maribacter chungangensis]|uniref:Discoidin domain-containing protein n=1 Tax=Maribacter chungangensis TaxID=1069117 RepID=A0ABW3B0Z0_9FLAO
MGKQLWLFLILLIMACFQGYSQLSDLHYLPPLKQGSNGGSVREQRIYLSTPETTPFTVNAYVGTSTTPIPFTISNTSPATYDPGDRNNGITMIGDSDTGVVISTAGLRFEAPGGQRFYANYRGSSGAQSTSLTAKGRQALGTAFKWGGVPNYGTTNEQGTSLGIMASENNTTVDIFGYDPNCEFRLGNDRDGITSNTIQVVLDAGESFVLEAHIAESTANVEGWLGASIVSDKPIAISNGGLNYAVVNGSGGSRDAGIDQPVPENNLGKDYIFVRGGGITATEFPIIIATQNNTQIFVNGSATPIATINNGDYFIVPGTNYSSGSAGANMYVRTSKDAYAYQNLAGTSGRQTVGLNFVAPLNCLIPDTVNNIPNITDAAGTTLTGGITIIAATTTPDANIIVTDGSGVVTKPSSQPVAGNTDWKTFYIPNLTGNVDVQSTGPIAVGFFGGNGNRGIAGYFSGFDVAPNVDLQITGTQCLPGASLEVIGEAFDAYQWFFDGNPIAGETGTTYNPTVAGDYFVRVTKGPCTYDSNNLQAYYCNPDIQLLKTADVTTVNEGGFITFTVTAQNFGVDPATNLVVTDVLPAGLSLISATPNMGSWSSPNWSIGTLTSGTLASIDIVALADLNNLTWPTQSLTNNVTNAQDQSDSNITADSPSATITILNDYDNDGVLDITDLDDDNDGILDTVECPASTVNLALSGTATLSSTYPAGDAFKANDGNTDGNWGGGSVVHTQATTGTEWLTIDLGNSEVIDEIQIWNRTDCCSERLSNAYVMVSNTPFPTNTDLNQSINNSEFTTQLGNTSLQSQIVIPVGITGRYVRLQLSGNNVSGGYINVGELQVFGPENCNSDTDFIPNSYDLDSDNDGCSDANEAYNDPNADAGDGGSYGTGTPPPTNGNGTVTAASYPTPADMDTNGTFDFQEVGVAPSISVEPLNQKVFIGNDGTVEVSSSDSDTYQWEVSTDGGTTFNPISDGSEYSGTQTDELNIISPDLTKNGYIYRALLTSNTFVCGQTLTNEIVLSVGPRTIITNRRITIRVNKD